MSILNKSAGIIGNPHTHEWEQMTCMGQNKYKNNLIPFTIVNY